MKRYSPSLIISEMQIKTTIIIISHLLGELLSKSLKITSVGEDVEKREPLCTVDGNVNWFSHCGNRINVPQKVKNRTTK